MGNAEQTEMQHVLERIDHLEKENRYLNFNQAFGNLPKSLLYFSQDRIKKPSYF